MAIKNITEAQREEERQLAEEVSAVEQIRQRQEQIDALSLTGTIPSRPKNSWLKFAGKYTEDSSLVQILDAGARIREAERDEQC